MLSFEASGQENSSLIEACAPCTQPNSNMSASTSWKDPDSTYVMNLHISCDSLICCPCRQDISRVLKDPEFIPRWTKKRGSGV